jgi:hypothetical protein
MAHELKFPLKLLFIFLSGMIFGVFYHNILPAILTFLIIEYFMYLELKTEIKNINMYLKYRFIDAIAYFIGWRLGKEICCNSCYVKEVRRKFIENKLKNCR